ncbi:autotransporter domain-containing protein [Ponticaulis sp.]|uniref:autotransporter domain-containing protein n=1 Tax=Ponticaulis sp. TaxID=2020902 RepID=UPI000B71C009|nr:autotransporter outer membrane beta-barrel domain-containing protein [Ponticaulis sp.]MAI90055.1 hypothetical protein [Ponticaulis sp.]OUX99711.1 MAG: hypothetical protein CBB65_06410 [Hyphomonadaceae bacterium TMED5]
MSKITFKRRSASHDQSHLKSLTRTLTVSLLCSTCLVPFAAAETEITDDLTTAIATSTIDDGSPDDIVIASGGSVVVSDTDGFIAVTVDSDNSVTNEGAITINDSDNSVGILIEPGFTGDIANNGSISLVEDYTREDEDDDDDADGDFALGTNRVGILLESGGTHTGSITSDSTSTISIEGNDSAGISLRSILDGSIALDGSITVLGDNAVGIEALEDVTGDVLLSGSISTQGLDAIGADLQGDIGGNLTIEGTIASFGFESTSVSNYIRPSQVDEDTAAVEDRLDADALYDNTAGVRIGGDIANGFLVNGAVDDFTSEEDEDDETKDTADDFDENRTTGQIVSYGSGPAVLITADDDSDLVLGTVVETVRDTTDDDDDDDVTETLAVFEYDYGFINRGSIIASGLNIGFDATGVRIEGNEAAGTSAIIEGGLLNTGSITATAFEANATALSLGFGTVMPTIFNDGTIQATSSTQNGHDAIAILIEDGASVPEFTNTGAISAGVTGMTGNAVGLRDESGTLTSFINNGTITTAQSSDGTTVSTNGEATALDFTASTTGVTLLQDFEEPVDDVNDDDVIDDNDVTTPAITGDVLFGSGNDSFTVLAGDLEGDVDFGTGDSIFSLSDSEAEGDVSFASGSQTLSLSGAILNGDLDFVDSTGSISITDGSTFSGAFTTSNSLLSLNISASDATFGAGTAAMLSDFSATGESTLTFEIDPDDTSEVMLSVAGDTYIGSNVVIAPILTSLPDELTAQTIISSGTLTFEGTLDDVQLTNVPWLYTTSLSETEGAVDTLDLIFELKSTEELGLDQNEAAAFDSLMGIFADDDELGAGVATLTTENSFKQFYDLLLPQRTDASTAFTATSMKAAIDALDDSLALVQEHRGFGTRIWAQEYFVNLDEDQTTSSPGYNGDGFGASLGVDRALFGLDAVGAFMAFHSGDFEEKTGGNNPVTTTSVGAGVYAADSLGPVNLRVAGLLSRLSFVSHREIETPSGESYETEGNWNGWSTTLSASASSEFDLGPIFIHPQVSVDWLNMTQDAYEETGGGGVLNAAIGEAETDRLTASAILGIGKDFNFSGGSLRAEIEGGIRSRVSSTPLSTEVSYVGSEESFILSAEEDAGEAAVLGLSITGGNEHTLINFGYNVETTDTGTAHYTGATIRFQF